MFTFIRNLVEAHKETLKNSKGAAMIEYALIIVGIVILAAVFFGKNGSITSSINSVLTTVNSELTTATGN